MSYQTETHSYSTDADGYLEAPAGCYAHDDGESLHGHSATQWLLRARENLADALRPGSVNDHMVEAHRASIAEAEAEIRRHGGTVPPEAAEAEAV